MASNGAMTPNPNMCTHNLRTISTKIEIMSTTPLVKMKNSTDLCSGRRPDSKSVELSIFTKGVVEI